MQDVLDGGVKLLAAADSPVSPMSAASASSSIAKQDSEERMKKERQEEKEAAGHDEQDTLDASIGDVTVHLGEMEEPLRQDLDEELSSEGEADATIILPQEDEDGPEEASSALTAPVPNSRHLGRSPSLLTSLAPSPLGLSAFPPFVTKVSPSVSSTTSSASLTRSPASRVSVVHSSTLDTASCTTFPSISSSYPPPKTHILLAARLRQERDQAISHLAFSTLEHDISIKTLEAELLELSSGRDALQNDLKEMVSKLIQGEELQRELTEVTDSLCQTESSFRQAKSRLETANAELHELRQRMAEQEQRLDPALQKQSALPLTHQCSCRDALEDLRCDNVRFEEELDMAVRQHHGAANLVLSLQTDLDNKDEELQRAYKAAEVERQTSSSLRRQLEEEKREKEEALVQIRQHHTAHTIAERQRSSEISKLQDSLDDVQVQLKGAVNRALALQRQVDEQFDEQQSLHRDREAMEARLAESLAANCQQESQLTRLRLDVKDELAERNALQQCIHNLVLVHLQTRQNVRKTSRTPSKANNSSLLIRSNDLMDNATSSSLIVAMTQTAAELSTLKTLHGQTEGRNRTLVKQVDCLEAEKRELHGHVSQKNASMNELAQTNDTLQGEVLSLHETVEEVRQKAVDASLRADLADQHVVQIEKDLLKRDEALRMIRLELNDQQVTIETLQTELSSTRESLRIAEEEGRNLVADFNMLSEELEHRQSEDETRTAHSESTQRRLTEAAAKEEELRARCALDETELADLRARLSTLETDLEAMQINVEETDDKYLESLKTIRKQGNLLDKLKVRNEALTRANTLLSEAVSNPSQNPMAPAPPSSKKRALPKEFVAPDPGPAAMLRPSSATSVRPEPEENVRRANEAARLGNPTYLNSIKRPGGHLVSTTRDQSAPKTVSSEPPSQSTIHATALHVTSAKPVRAPLAAVSSQRRIPSSNTDSQTLLKAKSGAAMSKTAFKPTSASAQRPHNKTAVSSDTRNLLAALHALKQPTPH